MHGFSNRQLVVLAVGTRAYADGGMLQAVEGLAQHLNMSCMALLDCYSSLLKVTAAQLQQYSIMHDLTYPRQVQPLVPAQTKPLAYQLSQIPSYIPVH